MRPRLVVPATTPTRLSAVRAPFLLIFAASACWCRPLAAPRKTSTIYARSGYGALRFGALARLGGGGASDATSWTQRPIMATTRFEHRRFFSVDAARSHDTNAPARYPTARRVPDSRNSPKLRRDVQEHARSTLRAKENCTLKAPRGLVTARRRAARLIDDHRRRRRAAVRVELRRADAPHRRVFTSLLVKGPVYTAFGLCACSSKGALPFFSERRGRTRVRDRAARSSPSSREVACRTSTPRRRGTESVSTESPSGPQRLTARVA